MSPVLPRPSLNGSALIGWLAREALLQGPAAAPSFVDGLGRWLGWKEAIPLSAALHAPLSAGAGAKPPPAPSVGAPGVEREFHRVRAALTRAIENDRSLATDTDFPPYRRHIAGLQQMMDAAISPLRAQARAAVARLSPSMSRLAALDAVMDEVVGAREQALLAMMASLLERHFMRLAQEAGGSGRDDWTAVFRQDLRRAMAAELELRLQPTQGLLEALRTETPREP